MSSMVSKHPWRWDGIYPGWWVALGACCSLGMVAGMTFWAFGLYAQPLHAEFGWSDATIAVAASLTLLISGCTSPLVGRLVDRFQPRRVIAIGTLGTAIIYLLLSQITTLWQFFLLISLLSFFRTWIFYIPFTTLITRWFDRRRTTAMGIATAGFSMGGLVFSPLLTAMTQWTGWRNSFLFSALLVIGINITFVVLARNDPPARWSHYDRRAIEPSSLPKEGIFAFSSVRAILGTPIFWCMALSFSFFFTAQWAFLYHGPQMFVFAGYSATTTTAIFSASAGLGVLLRFISGRFIDGIRRIELLGALVTKMMALSLLLLFITPHIIALMAFAVLWGIGGGIGPALEPLLVSRMFGKRHYASVYGIMDGLDTLIAIPGPWLGGIVFDHTHSYQPVLLIYATLFIGSAVSFLYLGWRAARHERRLVSAQHNILAYRPPVVALYERKNSA